jgi:NAD(P)-dependent dehydrogenase (short-subunit alcohol dehydrogenase family)
MADRFAEKVVIVTGAGKGMGESIAQNFAKAGAAVGLIDWDQSALDKNVKTITDAGGKAHGVKANVGLLVDVEKAVNEIVEKFGGLDIIVNAAGIIRYGTAEELSEQDWDDLMNVNTKAIFLTSKFGIPHIKKRGKGAILNFSSVQAFVSQTQVVGYTASKGAVIAMTRTLAMDHAQDNIRVIAIAPGSTDTPMLRQGAEQAATGSKTADDVLTQWAKDHPLGRLQTPQDMANLCMFLASDEASAITGTSITIDCGLTMQVAVALEQ